MHDPVPVPTLPFCGDLMKRHGLCFLLALCMGATDLALAQSSSDSAIKSTIIGQRHACVSGGASGFACSNIDLLAKLSVDDLRATVSPEDDVHITDLNDIWGWTDPDTGDEYALVGMEHGVSFVNITDPINPVVTGTLRSHNPLTRSIWRDMKVYRDHMFVVVDGFSGFPENGVQVFDLTQLRGVTEPRLFSGSAHYDGIASAHNIAINEETGFAYVVGSRGGTNGPNCGVGLHMIDIKDPLNPTYAGCFNDPNSGRSNSGYTHDVQCVIYRGPDERYQGREICLGSNETRLSIADVTDKENPTLIASVSYPEVGYAHQGWLTKDQEYFLMNDEFDERGLGYTRTIIWDIDVLDDPIFMRPFENPVGSTDHNLYIRNGYAFQANYRSGLRIIDIEDIHAPQEIGFFDTVPDNDSPGFLGAWSAYPFFDSNTIIVSSIHEGLFVLQATNHRSRVSTEEEAEVPESFHLSSVYPNPFNPNALVTLSLAEAQAVRIAAYDLHGREVALLHNGHLPVGAHDFRFEAGHLPSGVYAIKAIGAGATQVSMATLAK